MLTAQFSAGLWLSSCFQPLQGERVDIRPQQKTRTASRSLTVADVFGFVGVAMVGVLSHDVCAHSQRRVCGRHTTPPLNATTRRQRGRTTKHRPATGSPASGPKPKALDQRAPPLAAEITAVLYEPALRQILFGVNRINLI